MRRFRFISCMFVIAVMICCTSNTSNASGVNTFPSINKIGYTQYELFQMRQGWYQDNLVWFISTDTNSLNFARDSKANNTVYWQGSTFAPKLTSATYEVATVYIILNYQQGPVFTSIPDNIDYSGVWRVIFIQYYPEITPHAVTNTDPYDPITNPSGLPLVSEAEYFSVDEYDRPLIVKYPIMAVGALGGPWYPSAGKYRIPQAKVDPNYAYTKQIRLPFWYVYCQNPVNNQVCIRRVIVPDVWDPPSVPDSEKLATKIGANVAPGLAAIMDGAKQNFFFMNGPKPINQYPILQACPSDLLVPWRNTNFNYSPIMTYAVFNRFIPSSSVINNPITFDMLWGLSKLGLVRNDQIINAPVIPEMPLG